MSKETSQAPLPSRASRSFVRRYVRPTEYEALLVSRRPLTRMDDPRSDVACLCDREEGVLYFRSREDEEELAG